MTPEANQTAAREHRKAKHEHEIIFYTYPKLIFAWLLIVAGFVLWPISGWGWFGPETLAWFWGLLLFVTVLTMGVDINRNVTVFWMVVIAACWLAVIYLRDVRGFTIFGAIYNFFADLNPDYSRSLGLLVSIFLSIPFGVMLVWSRLNSKWRITHNEFEHFQFGKQDDSLGRGAKRVRSSYPDFFELLLCLAGDLVVYDATGMRELRRIPHVPLLPMVRKRIGLILESTAITPEDLGAVEQEAAEGDTEHNV
ncbi:MAG: hypothetical protein HY717_12490 [Planctomycetes bacterium]|nr:hypothetical protein [Planctomycetota bacterium]